NRVDCEVLYIKNERYFYRPSFVSIKQKIKKLSSRIALCIATGASTTYGRRLAAARRGSSLLYARTSLAANATARSSLTCLLHSRSSTRARVARLLCTRSRSEEHTSELQ